MPTLSHEEYAQLLRLLSSTKIDGDKGADQSFSGSATFVGTLASPSSVITNSNNCP